MMAKAMKHIPLDELAHDLVGILDRVAREREGIIVERDGAAIAVVKPVATATPRRRHRGRGKTGYDALLAAAGSWKDVDIDRFLADNAESRQRSSRPPIEL
jgi:hypothetical protein